MAAVERQCTVLLPFERVSATDEISELQSQLESPDVAVKSDAMKKITKMILNGEQMGSLLMFVIRFIVPSDDHSLKKLVYIYLECADKFGPDGKLLPEMILVCNMLRNDLNHPNEFVRGSALRFLSKLKETEILEPLVPSIRANLEHRHSYVRRNAVLALFNCWKTEEVLVLDAADVMEEFLNTESDASAKRNAFTFLVKCGEERAVEHVLSVLESLGSMQDINQLVMLELVRRVCRADPLQKSRYMSAMVSLLSSPSPSVSFECCGTLISLSTNTHVVRAAAQSYCQLLSHHSDNNVRLVVLGFLTELKTKHRSILQELLMDILRGLSSPSTDIKRKILDLAMELVDPRNIDAVVGMLKKEIVKTQNDDSDKNGEYRQMLIQCIHSCVVKFPEVAGGVVHLLMDFVGDNNSTSSGDVILFIREVVQMYPTLRESVIQRLVDTFPQIRTPKVYRAAVWIFSQYCISSDEVEQAIAALRASLGDLPFGPPQTDGDASTDADAPTHQHKPRVLADGTYASESAQENRPSKAVDPTSSQPTLRSLILGGDFFLAAVVAGAIAKLMLRLSTCAGTTQSSINSLAADLMLYMCGVLRFGRSSVAPSPIDNDAHERLCGCLTMLSDLASEPLREVWLEKTQTSFAGMLAEKQAEEKKEAQAIVDEKTVKTQADDLILVRQLRGKQLGGADVIEEDEGDLQRATGAGDMEEEFSARLSRVMQLTGLSDPVYAEAVVTVHSYDIVLDVLVINQTDATLNNVSLELSTVGDLKLCERPLNYTLPPRGSRSLRANIKVSSTETGIIYGSIVFETPNSQAGDGQKTVVLSDIHIDIMDYITPSTCSELQFRIMWAEFEWENKVAIATDMTDPTEYLHHVCKCTNMKCLTPPSALRGDCAFLAANLYAKSIFGEDALVNLSIEKPADGPLTGSIRIRSKTQGIALSLGDKITLKQKGPEKK